MAVPLACTKGGRGKRDYTICFLLLQNNIASCLCSKADFSWSSIQCFLCSACCLDHWIQYVNRHFAKLTEGWPWHQHCASSVSPTECWRSKNNWFIMKNTGLRPQTAPNLSHKFHVPLNQLPPLRLQTEYSKRNTILQKFVCK